MILILSWDHCKHDSWLDRQLVKNILRLLKSLLRRLYFSKFYLLFFFFINHEDKERLHFGNVYKARTRYILSEVCISPNIMESSSINRNPRWRGTRQGKQEGNACLFCETSPTFALLYIISPKLTIRFKSCNKFMKHIYSLNCNYCLHVFMLGNY